MPAVVWVAAAAVVLPMGMIVQATLSRPARAQAITRRNLTRGLFTPTFEVGTLEARHTGAGALLRALTPDRSARRLRHMIDVAGRPAGLTMTRMLWAKLVLAAVAALVGAAEVAGHRSAPAGCVVLAVVVLAYHLPELAMYGRGQERRKVIARELPDVLDQMTIAVEAGLGFEAALARAASTGKGALAEELVRTLQDVTVGRPRREAYEALVRRTEVTDLKRFVSAINQADTYGIAIADVLRIQAGEMRVKRRQRAEEEAMKVPVRVTFPLIVCILPALLIVVAGPAVLGLAGVFG
ncbi:MAG: Tight adherence protein [Modestobacter sp.]|jgi:tight adherence protein C|nr:Tight adherence protein [Modestobacter sp.]